MSDLLIGKVAIVTGGGRGLGFGIAKALAAKGASIALTGRNADDLDRAVAELESSGPASAHQGDVASSAAVEACIEAILGRHGRIDILVNNAGIADEAAFLDIREAGWRSVLDINLTGAFLMTQRVGRVMRDQGHGGSMVSIGSIEAHGADGPFASYVAAKFGLRGLTMSAAIELAQYGIRVNSVSPGWVHTDMAEATLRPTMLRHMLEDFRRVPMKRMVTVEEVAETVAFLASPAASGITGTDILVDGGTLADIHIHRTLPDEGGAS